MALTIEQVRSAAAKLGSELFRTATANLNLDDLKAAVQSIDDTMDLNPNSPSLSNSLTLKQNFVTNLPEPFKSNTDAAQKAFALNVWALAETGQI